MALGFKKKFSVAPGVKKFGQHCLKCRQPELQFTVRHNDQQQNLLYSGDYVKHRNISPSPTKTSQSIFVALCSWFWTVSVRHIQYTFLNILHNTKQLKMCLATTSTKSQLLFHFLVLAIICIKKIGKGHNSEQYQFWQHSRRSDCKQTINIHNALCSSYYVIRLKWHLQDSSSKKP